ncbi:MAG: class I SAM-dependent methyltransferase, partial [Smithellaceae bacterium]|nr:class I SAM-dependent methyltransferase [Smithellaceae bacterium]
MIFDRDMARRYDDWLATPAGRYMDKREKGLILSLVNPRPGERLLDVGCGTGEHLLLFREQGCDVTGLEPSAPMREIAIRKLGARFPIQEGVAEDLPFSDNEFDIVTLITTLEFVTDPVKAIAEAARVSRDRVFIGALNSLSFLGTRRKLAGLFVP